MRTLYTLLLVIGIAAFSLPAFAGSDDPARRVAVDSAKAEAATLLKKGDADGAYDLYIRLLREIPGDDAVNLGLARAATQIQRFNIAVIAYETLLEKYPREAGLYGELAHVYMLLGDRESAERSASMMRSLDGSAAAESARALDTLEERYSLWQVHGTARTGLLYDSNANLGPNSDVMNLGAWRVTVENAKKQETFGVYAGADVDFARRFYRDSPWYWVGDVRAFWRGNSESALDTLHSRESQWGRVSTGLRHMSATTLTEARFKAEVFDYDFYQRVSAFGPEVTFLWAVTPTFQLITKGGIDKRLYSRDPRRDGAYGWIGEYARFFFGKRNHEWLVGGRYIGASADRRDYGYNGWEGTTRLMFKLPYGFEWTPFATYTRENYLGPATILESKERRDRRWRLGSTLTYRIDQSWSLELNYQYSKNDSSSALYEYRQHYVSGGIALNF
ncbi:MAG: surface lipoprotein assembly modifier [Burkholderiaceae bacterium]|jgi:tetratricopeptide (TPR) repeat protein|nr:surface lipoprotein assembly modifier [Burkholderiaceae bacterium]